MRSPGKLASRPPAIKISGDIPMDSGAPGIVPGALTPAARPGCCGDFIYSKSRTGSRCYSAPVQGRAARGGERPHPAPPCTHTRCATLVRASTDATAPGIEAKGPLHGGWRGGDARMDDGGSPALRCALPCQEQPPSPEQSSGAAAFTRCLGVGGKDSPRPFWAGSRAAVAGYERGGATLSPPPQQLKHCNGVGSPPWDPTKDPPTVGSNEGPTSGTTRWPEETVWTSVM